MRAALIARGKFAVEVSNLDYDIMQALWRILGTAMRATNPGALCLASRGGRYDLLPWCQQQRVVMAYARWRELARLRSGLPDHPVVNNCASA